MSIQLRNCKKKHQDLNLFSHSRHNCQDHLQVLHLILQWHAALVVINGKRHKITEQLGLEGTSGGRHCPTSCLRHDQPQSPRSGSCSAPWVVTPWPLRATCANISSFSSWKREADLLVSSLIFGYTQIWKYEFFWKYSNNNPGLLVHNVSVHDISIFFPLLL